MTTPDYLVCGTIPAPDAGAGFCCRCLVKVWPTTGSLAFAKANGIALVCLDCAADSKDYQFAGAVDHGRMVGGGWGEAIALAVELYRQRKQKEN